MEMPQSSKMVYSLPGRKNGIQATRRRAWRSTIMMSTRGVGRAPRFFLAHPIELARWLSSRGAARQARVRLGGGGADLDALLDGGAAAARRGVAREHGHEGLAVLVDGQANDHDGRGPAPHEGERDPQVPHGLGEDAKGEGGERPHDDEHQADAAAPLDDPGLSRVEELLRHLPVGHLGRGGRAAVVVDEGDLLRVDLPVEVLRLGEGDDGADERREQQRRQVARELRLERAEGVDLVVLDALVAAADHAVVLGGGHHDPRDDRADVAHDGAGDGAGGADAAVEHEHGHGPDGGADHNPHEVVHPADADAQVLEERGEGALEDAVAEDGDARDTQDVGARGLGVDILAVDVVGDERRDGDALGRAGGGDGHEEHDDHEDAAALAHHDRGRGRRHQAAARLLRRELDVERVAGEAERGGEREGDGEPDEAAEEVALVRRGGRGRDGRLPVGLVHEDGAEVAHDVDDAELEAREGEHGQVRAATVERAALGVGRGGAVVRAGGGRGHEATRDHSVAALLAGRVEGGDELETLVHG
mmetsp:Transcript_48449/g.116527  ORF Transcript_48449/g.116527 Transcript_48449/m.116527 type:complete len:533 (+) Transcript_48449:67-1665(+)